MTDLANETRSEPRERRGRVDATAKATGAARYVADYSVPGMVHVAAARSSMPHARIVSIDKRAALASPGVIAVFTAEDVSEGTYGRAVADSPVLARGKVRFVGERVAAVVAETREQAEAAAALVDIEYEPLVAVTTPEEALAAGAPLVHDAPWSYRGAVIEEGDGPNLIYHHTHGSLEEFEAAYAAAAHKIDHVYRTQGVHQGYLEPQACIADYRSADEVKLWLTNKAPFRVRSMIGSCLGIDPNAIELQPIYLGGDFGGKGSPGDSPMCVELSRLLGRPVKSVLRYSEDLTGANPRHPSEIRIRLACDAQGNFVALAMDATLNAGAYAGFTPGGSGPHGAVDPPAYRIPTFFSEIKRVYTNTVPRGNMRAPGAPQGTFACESAIDELAVVAGIDPVELRRRNLLEDGEVDPSGHAWVENRGSLTLEAALGAFTKKEAPAGWLYGRGVALYGRGTTTNANTSLRVIPQDDGCVRVETGIVETGTGSHTVLRELIAEQLGFSPDQVEVATVSTDELPRDAGAGGSRVTAGLAIAVDAASKAWHNRLRDESVMVEVDEIFGPDVGSYIVQIAQVAVDPATGELRVLEIENAVDVAAIINPKAHQMQIDGGVTMGLGYACLEDLDESDGQVWAANLGEFKIASSSDVPEYKTVLVRGARGVGTANVKNIGESTTPPVGALIANAVYAATGCRIRELPVTAERIYEAMHGGTGA